MRHFLIRCFYFKRSVGAGMTGESYLCSLAETDRSLSRQISELPILASQYGPESALLASAARYFPGEIRALENFRPKSRPETGRLQQRAPQSRVNLLLIRMSIPESRSRIPDSFSWERKSSV